MTKLFQILFHPILLGALALTALSALVWFVLPVVAIGDAEPFDPAWVRILIIALMWSIWLGRIAWKSVKRRRTNAALVNGMAKGPSAADREVEALGKRFGQAVEMLKSAPGAVRCGVPATCPGLGMVVPFGPGGPP